MVLQRSASEQARLQRQLADRITGLSALDDIRIVLASGASGLRPLHYAAYSGSEECMRLLLARGAQLNAVDDVGYTALHLCAEQGNGKLAQLLIDHGARVSFVDADKEHHLFPRSYKCDEPLRLAIKGGHFRCARLLLENGASANARYFLGSEITMLHPAADVDFLRLLLLYGADANVYDRDGLTPLMKACRCRHGADQAVRLLIEFGAYPSAMALPKQDLRTPLHYAILGGSEDLVEVLLQANARVNMRRDYDRPSPLDLAVARDRPALVKRLLQAGADVSAVHTYIGAPLHLAACSNLVHMYEIAELLLEAGADANQSHEYEDGAVLKTPLVEYLRSQDLVEARVVRLLLRHGASVVLRSQMSDPRGQLRNLLKVHATQPDVYEMLLNAAESFDLSAIRRLPLPIKYRLHLINVASRPALLKHICRVHIRRSLAPMTAAKISRLSLPQRLQSYILFQP